MEGRGLEVAWRWQLASRWVSLHARDRDAFNGATETSG
jgi:hypothetical protein